MTKDEFNSWVEFHEDLFQELDLWLANLDEGRRQRMLSEWFRVLTRVAFADAVQCSRRMLSGEIDHPHHLDLSRLPAAILAGSPLRVTPASELRGKVYNPTTGSLT